MGGSHIRASLVFTRAALQEVVAQLRDAKALACVVLVLIGGLYLGWLYWIFPVLRVNIQSAYTQVKLSHGSLIALALVMNWQTIMLCLFLGASTVGCFAYIRQSPLLRVFYGRLRDPAPISTFVIAYTLLSLLIVVELVLYPITWAPFLHTLSRPELASLVSAKIAAYATALLILALAVNLMGRVDKAEHAVLCAWGANGVYYLVTALFSYRVYYEANHLEKALVLKVVGRLLRVWIRPEPFPWRDPAVGALVIIFLVATYFTLTNGVRRALE